MADSFIVRNADNDLAQATTIARAENILRVMNGLEPIPEDSVQTDELNVERVYHGT